MMSNIPTKLQYTKTHEWIKKEDEFLTIGITDHAQTMLGDLVYVELPEIETSLNGGQECAVVESVKAASDIYSPIAGEVIAVNEALSAEPELLNSDPYGAWIFKLKPSNTADLEKLLDAAGYKAAIGE